MDKRVGLMIEKQEHRERLLKAIQDYNQLRKGFISNFRQFFLKLSVSEPGLFDGNATPRVEYL